uniref:Uncharacterized protein n=1 Tax=Amphimedon queenslandica TaxID=400682 RepID=A0A1X7U503_AMPQE
SVALDLIYKKIKKSANRPFCSATFFHLHHHHQVRSPVNPVVGVYLSIGWCYKDDSYTNLLQQSMRRSMSHQIILQVRKK